MTQLEQLENEAILIIDNIAFKKIKINNNIMLLATNIKNIKQTILFKYVNNNFVLVNGDMSEANTYKTLYSIEKNKSILAKSMS